MPFDNYLKLGLDNRPVFHQAGARRIMFVKSDLVANISYGEEDYVEDIVLRAGGKWNLFNDLENLSYNLTPEITRNGTIYGVEVGFTVRIQTRAKNRLFDSMRETDLTAIIQDKNNRWWLVGLEQPLRLTLQEQKIDNENNLYTIKMATRQRENVREMSPVWVITIPQLDFNDSVDSVDGGTLDIKVSVALNNGGLNPPGSTMLGNNFQNTIYGPPTGYVILDTVGVVFANPGTTIKLPANAQNGQQHTVKDLSNSASVSAILVTGNGRLIDGNPEPVRINTDGGAMTFTYQNNAWLITSFVN